nr:hypothetical protein [Bordetella bronchiseptica]
MGQVGAPLRRQRQPAGGAVEQLEADLPLELLDQVAERALRHRQRLGGLAETAQVVHERERSQLPERDIQLDDLHVALVAPAGPCMAVPEHRSNICSFSIYHRKERIKPVSGRR